MHPKNDIAMVCCGRGITHKEIKEIQKTVCLFSNLSRKELTQTICEHLDWRRASGSNKYDACLKMLEKLEAKGSLQLPAKRVQVKPKATKIVLTSKTEPEPTIKSIAGGFSNINLQIVTDKKDIRLWNEYMLRYHYLGYSQPFGYVMRYFIKNGHKILGCLLFSGASKSMTVRDKWIEWTTNQRLRNLAWVVNNSRFLIFPWVSIKNLASHVLGKVGRRIKDDWYKKWDFQPVLMETFVDPELYHGTCYQASNWEYLGMTTGQGLVRKGKTYKTSPKKIYMKPLIKDFRKILCSKNLTGNVAYE
ncbi:MAG: DUF4338 domain-containing protein [Desulfobacula sp.]|jgi:hypothetical protein|uniref:DUF4338 domain-containing protein n=1 Tax=Desulfobacula sp. TaxID=2593537 RepID=UPI001DDFF469|nr:DUF4338 domain-containing protein [Desulfobacula sp.]MBT3807801.1 DUF4338 domain-containing protein [Desulfobacula sp.]MBT4509216.1 DUF4338 domain-containing protein [Desulfobacula sp.]MBT4875213.1 DUF4338 domain-containing protein [Desulfobacula sp.]MBT5974035.1 DUF4338 domain-containing protein [Desulfobacula sp.]